MGGRVAVRAICSTAGAASLFAFMGLRMTTMAGRTGNTTRRNDFLSLRLPSQVADTLRRRAAARGWSMSEFVRIALDAALAAEDRSAR